jgi:LacI family transcriptional regulator
MGLVFHEEASLSDFYHGHVLEGVRRGAMARGADLVLLQFGEDWRKECLGFVYVNPMRKQLNSMPWFGAQTGTRPRTRSSKKPPVVVVGASFDHDHVHSIDTDNVDLAEQAVGHLADYGHRRIAYVGGGAEVSNNIDRWHGFSQSMARAGLVATDHVLRVPGWKLSDGDRARLVAMLAGPNRPTAIFAAGYYFALDVYSVARELELDIPGDLSVIGVDDPPSAGFLSPRLTTLRQPLLDMGRLAAESLLDLSVSPTAHEKHRRLRAELVRRGSTAGPPVNP